MPLCRSLSTHSLSFHVLAEGDTTVPWIAYTEAWLYPARVARMRDFALAPATLKRYMEQTCSTADFDTVSDLGKGMWEDRWLGVPLPEGPSQSTVTACYNRRLFRRFVACATPHSSACHPAAVGLAACARAQPCCGASALCDRVVATPALLRKLQAWQAGALCPCQQIYYESQQDCMRGWRCALNLQGRSLSGQRHVQRCPGRWRW